MSVYLCKKKIMELHKTLHGLMQLCLDHMNEIREHKELGYVLKNSKVRYISPTGQFEYTTFGHFYFNSMGVMMLITRRKYTEYRIMDEPMGYWSTVPVIFAGIDTGFKYDNREPIFSDDVCCANGCTSVVRFLEGDDAPSLEGDNCDLLLQDCTHGLEKVGTIWYDIDPAIFEIRREEYHGQWNIYGNNELDKIKEATKKPKFIKPLKIKSMPMMYYDIKHVTKDYPYHICAFSEKIPPYEDEETYIPTIYADMNCRIPNEQYETIPLDDFPDDDTLDISDKMAMRFRNPIKRIIDVAYHHPEIRFIVCNCIKEMNLTPYIIKKIQAEFHPIQDYMIRNVCLPYELLDLVYYRRGKDE